MKSNEHFNIIAYSEIREKKQPKILHVTVAMTMTVIIVSLLFYSFFN